MLWRGPRIIHRDLTTPGHEPNPPPTWKMVCLFQIHSAFPSISVFVDTMAVMAERVDEERIPLLQTISLTYPRPRPQRRGCCTKPCCAIFLLLLATGWITFLVLFGFAIPRESNLLPPNSIGLGTGISLLTDYNTISQDIEMHPLFGSLLCLSWLFSRELASIDPNPSLETRSLVNFVKQGYLQ